MIEAFYQTIELWVFLGILFTAILVVDGPR
jgi:hypothetical protein